MHDYAAYADIVPNRERDRVADELRRLIITMELPAGVVLSQGYLAKRLQCGRTPLREALQRLAQERLVVPMPSGICIAGLSIIDYVQLSEALEQVDVQSARLAAKRVGDRDVARLSSIIEGAEVADESRDFATVAERDFEFHHTIALVTGNTYIADMSARLNRLSVRFDYCTWQRAGSAKSSLLEHGQILEALRAGDPSASEDRMRDHIIAGRERITVVL